MLTVLTTISITLKKRLHTLKTKTTNPKKGNTKKYKTLTAILKSFDTFVIFAKTSSSITLSVTGMGLIAKPISTATACRSSIGNKVINEIITHKYKNTKNNMKMVNKTIKSFQKNIQKNFERYCNR